jgi:hypothetical protein
MALGAAIRSIGTKIGRGLRRSRVWIGVAGGLFLVLWIVTGSESYQSCLDNPAGDADQASYRHIAGVETPSETAFYCLGDFLDQNEPAIIALAAIAIALFTGSLWVATARLWRATDRLVKGAEDTAQRQLRAYVTGIPEFMFSFDEEHLPYVKFRVHNSGLTPAKDVRHRTEINTLPHHIEPGMTLPPPSGPFSAPFVLFPHTDFFGTKRRDAVFDRATIAAIRSEAVCIYVYGEIEYVDAFGSKQSTTFCQAVRADADTLTKLTSLYGPSDLKLTFEIAPMGNKAT